MQNKIKYVNVFLEDANYAAVDLNDGSLHDSDLMILHSDRAVTEGSRIHLLE